MNTDEPAHFAWEQTELHFITAAPKEPIEAEIVGGNLAMWQCVIGTPYAGKAKGKILFLEDTGLTTDEIDRRLTHLWMAGKLSEVKGIIFGKFDTDVPYLAVWARRFTQEEVLAERCKELAIPAIFGMMIGHINDQTTVPIGCQAELDVDAGTLTLLEQAVQ